MYVCMYHFADFHFKYDEFHKMFRNQGQASLPPGRDPSYATTTTKITTTSTTTTTTEPPITTTVPRIGKKQKNTF